VCVLKCMYAFSAHISVTCDPKLFGKQRECVRCRQRTRVAAQGTYTSIFGRAWRLYQLPQSPFTPPAEGRVPKRHLSHPRATSSQACLPYPLALPCLTLLRMDPVPLTNAQSGAAHARFGPCVVIDDVPGACVASWDITRGAPRPDRPDFPRSPQEARCNQRWRAAHPGCTVHTGSQCLLMAPRSDPGPFRGSIARSDRPIGSTSP
jgi:hypothetical protein